jgi:hypothetical protein
MGTKFFYTFFTAVFLIGALKLVVAGNFQIDLLNSTKIDTFGRSF